MANEETSAVLSFLDGPDGAIVMMGYFAEVGGDPEQYGLEDLTSFEDITHEQMILALRLYMQTTADVNQLNPQTTVAVRSGVVDWEAISDRISQFMQDFSNGNVTLPDDKIGDGSESGFSAVGGAVLPSSDGGPADSAKGASTTLLQIAVATFSREDANEMATHRLRMFDVRARTFRQTSGEVMWVLTGHAVVESLEVTRAVANWDSLPGTMLVATRPGWLDKITGIHVVSGPVRKTDDPVVAFLAEWLPVEYLFDWDRPKERQQRVLDAFELKSVNWWRGCTGFRRVVELSNGWSGFRRYVDETAPLVLGWHASKRHAVWDTRVGGPPVEFFAPEGRGMDDGERFIYNELFVPELAKSLVEGPAAKLHITRENGKSTDYLACVGDGGARAVFRPGGAHALMRTCVRAG